MNVSTSISAKYKLMSEERGKQGLYVIFFQKLVTGGDDGDLAPGLYSFAKLFSSFYADDTIEPAI